jgi:hypothetical protein
VNPERKNVCKLYNFTEEWHGAAAAAGIQQRWDEKFRPKFGMKSGFLEVLISPFIPNQRL